MRVHRRRRNLGLEIKRNMNGQALKFTSLYDFQKKKTRLTFAGGVVEDDLFASDDERLSLREFSIKK